MLRRSLLAFVLLALVGAGCTSSPVSPNTAGVTPPSNVATNTVVPSTLVPTNTAPTTPTSSACATPVSPKNLKTGDVLALAKAQRASSFSVIDQANASVISLDGGKSYAVWWAPQGFDPKTGLVLVDLHGHGEFAAKAFEVWYPELKKRNNMAILAVEWWFGRSLESNGYYEPEMIAKVMEEGLTAEGVTSPNIILQGFSMGSARSYGVTAWEHVCGADRIAAVISNSGEWQDSYPINQDMMNGVYGEKPLASIPWVLFCGEQDSEREGICDSMRTLTQPRLESLGANVLQLVTDLTGNHGSFNTNASNAEKVLDMVVAAL